MRKTTIRSRLITYLLLIVLVSLCIFSSYVLWHFNQYTTETIATHLHEQACFAGNLATVQLQQKNGLSGLDPLIKQVSADTGLRITVIAKDGTVLADSWEQPANMENHAQRPEVQEALHDHSGNSQRFSTTSSTQLLYASVPLYQNGQVIGVVRAATALTSLHKSAANLQHVILAAVLLTAIISIFLSYRLARRFTAPLETITCTARLMGEGQLENRIHIRTGDELEVLSGTLNTLATNLDKKLHETLAGKQKLETILAHMDNGVLLLDSGGQLLSLNAKAKKLFGLSEPVLEKLDLPVLKEPLFADALQQVKTSCQPQIFHLPLDTPSQLYYFQVFITSLGQPAGNPAEFLAVFHDITTLHELREKQAEFVANASHELSTPLTSIRGFTETLLAGAGEQPDAREKFLKIILSEADRMQRLISDLLQLAHLESQTSTLDIQSVNLNQFLPSILQQISLQVREKNQTLLSVPLSEDLLAQVNPDALRQVLLNLLDNALKYTPSGSTIALKWFARDHSAIIIVEDNGPGIPASDLPRLFERFYRVDRGRGRQTGGTGLGLAIAKHLVKNMNGSLSVASYLGQGTTFTLILPASKKTN